MNSIKILHIAFALLLWSTAWAGADFLPQSTPEEQGIPSQSILEFIDAAEADPDQAAHSLIIIRNGHVVAEGYWKPYAKEQPHELFSLSKSFTSTAVGLAVEEGLLDIDDRVVDFFPQYTPEDASWFLKNMRVRQLLTMSTGHLKEPEILRSASTEPLVKQFLAVEPELEPGKYFLYNTPATYMQSAIVQKLTGHRVRNYLMPRLFTPLGIETPKWDQSPDGIDYGGFGLYLKTRDIAKFGQLLLQRGKWQGQQLVPAGWFDQATSKQVSNGASPESDWNNGYGFQFWMNASEGFRGDGAFGQLCVVLPDANMVVAMTAAVRDMQKELRWIWNILLPVLSDNPLPANTQALLNLENKLDSLVLALPQGDAKPDVSLLPVGTTFKIEDNILGLETIRAVDSDTGITLEIDTDAGLFSLPVKVGDWTETAFVRNDMFGNRQVEPAFVASAWESPSVMNLTFVYEGRCRLLRLQVAFGDVVRIKPSYNVSFRRETLPDELVAVPVGIKQ